MEKKVFFDEKFQGEAAGGFYLRNDLKEFLEKLAEKQLNPVGIVFDGSFNLEILVEKNKEYEQYIKETK
jgi:hypothetical protein